MRLPRKAAKSTGAVLSRLLNMGGIDIFSKYLVAKRAR